MAKNHGITGRFSHEVISDERAERRNLVNETLEAGRIIIFSIEYGDFPWITIENDRIHGGISIQRVFETGR